MTPQEAINQLNEQIQELSVNVKRLEKSSLSKKDIENAISEQKVSVKLDHYEMAKKLIQHFPDYKNTQIQLEKSIEQIPKTVKLDISEKVIAVAVGAYFLLTVILTGSSYRYKIDSEAAVIKQQAVQDTLTAYQSGGVPHATTQALDRLGKQVKSKEDFVKVANKYYAQKLEAKTGSVAGK